MAAGQPIEACLLYLLTNSLPWDLIIVASSATSGDHCICFLGLVRQQGDLAVADDACGGVRDPGPSRARPATQGPRCSHISAENTVYDTFALIHRKVADSPETSRTSSPHQTPRSSMLVSSLEGNPHEWEQQGRRDCGDGAVPIHPTLKWSTQGPRIANL